MLRAPLLRVLATCATWIACAVVSGCRATAAVLTEPPLYNVDEQGVGLHGHDRVSYFPEGGGVPRVGSSDITARHQETV